MTENIEPTPASAISKLSDVGEMIERSLVSKDELTREVGAIALEATQALCEALAKVPRWISVEERLPEEAGKYIVCTRKKAVYCTAFRYFYDKGYFATDSTTHITHWMYMPDPPKEGEADA